MYYKTDSLFCPECLKKIKGIDILEVAQRLGLPVTSYKKSIV
mgnify:FL=1